jgi:dipeptidyl aminopeptidase/acylaminoacyl peptidase
VAENQIRLWTQGQTSVVLADAGGVSDVRLSDDGRVIAFMRGIELWAVNSDGTGERALIDVEDLAAMVEPGDSGVRVHRVEWVPGTHVLAFNTREDLEIGLLPFDDLHLVDADTLEHSVLLGRGEGGEFTYSPDGGQIAVVRSGTLDLVDADGGNQRQGMTYTPPVTYSEFQEVVWPVWSADSRSLRVLVPPPDPLAQPMQTSTVWTVHTDGRPPRLMQVIEAVPNGSGAFSPDLRYVAYLAPPEGEAPTHGESDLLITDLEDGETVTYAHDVGTIYGWSPDSSRLAFLARSPLPHALVGELGDAPVPVHGDLETASIDVRWLDSNRFLYTAITTQDRTLFLTEIGASNAVVAVVQGRSLVYDACLCGVRE